MNEQAESNAWVANQLRELAARLQLEDGLFRPRAYRRAADTVEQLHQPIAELYETGGMSRFEELPGIGSHIARTIVELFESGSISQLERLRQKTPVDVAELLAVDGIGPKTLKILWEQLHIKTLKDLDAALCSEQLQKISGFGPKREERLRRALRIYQRGATRVPIEDAVTIAAQLRNKLVRHPAVRSASAFA